MKIIIEETTGREAVTVYNALRHYSLFCRAAARGEQLDALGRHTFLLDAEIAERVRDEIQKQKRWRTSDAVTTDTEAISRGGGDV